MDPTTRVRFTVAPNRDDLDLLTTLIEAGLIKTHIGSTVTLDDVDAALERLEAGRTRGKITVTVADRPTATDLAAEALLAAPV